MRLFAISGLIALAAVLAAPTAAVAARWSRHGASLADTILAVLVGHVVRRSLGHTTSTNVPLGMA